MPRRIHSDIRTSPFGHGRGSMAGSFGRGRIVHCLVQYIGAIRMPPDCNGPDTRRLRGPAGGTRRRQPGSRPDPVTPSDPLSRLSLDVESRAQRDAAPHDRVEPVRPLIDRGWASMPDASVRGPRSNPPHMRLGSHTARSRHGADTSGHNASPPRWTPSASTDVRPADSANASSAMHPLGLTERWTRLALGAAASAHDPRRIRSAGPTGRTRAPTGDRRAAARNSGFESVRRGARLDARPCSTTHGAVVPEGPQVVRDRRSRTRAELRGERSSVERASADAPPRRAPRAMRRRTGSASISNGWITRRRYVDVEPPHRAPSTGTGERYQLTGSALPSS